MAATIVIQGIVRPRRLTRVRLLDSWTVVNIVVQIGAHGRCSWLAGGGPFKYLVASTVFAIGLHPLGARWIQEHFALAPGQETYSYYGPLNKVAFNVGYHNEHHDLVTIPWSRLPQVRRIAPEFYDGLHAYTRGPRCSPDSCAIRRSRCSTPSSGRRDRQRPKVRDSTWNAAGNARGSLNAGCVQSGADSSIFLRASRL